MELTSTDVLFRTRVEQTVAAIRKAILEGRLKWGERLIEAELAATFKIGQPTVREALIRLEHRGFLTRVPHRGTFVFRPTFEQAVEIYRVRENLEVFALKLARSRVTEAGLARVRAHLKGMEEAAARRNEIEFLEADLAFHRAVWEMSGNKCLANMLELLTGPLLTAGGVLALQRGESNSQSATSRLHQRMANCLTEGTDQDVEETMHELYACFLAEFQQLTKQPSGGKDEGLPREGGRISEVKDLLRGTAQRRV
jgi:DNA-binding GntR family transcriptional regulator